jgi:hypothetical protein
VIELIKDWIKRGCPYEEGRSLYEQMGSNQGVKVLLRSGSSSFFKAKLTEAMMQMLQSGSEAVNLKVEQSILKPKPVISYGKAHLKTLPNDVAALVQLKGKLYKDAATLHATILKSNDAEKRKTAAFEILRLMSLNQNCWTKLNYFDKYGALPVEENTSVDVSSLSSGEREQMIRRHKTFLSRSKWVNNSDAIEHPKYSYYRSEYDRRKNELEELQKEI